MWVSSDLRDYLGMQNIQYSSNFLLEFIFQMESHQAYTGSLFSEFN